MRFDAAAAVVCLLLCVPVVHSAENIDSRLESVALFKNGIGVVKRVVQVSGPGRYMLPDMPTPVHGTFWLESDAVVTTTTVQRDVEVPLDETAGLDLGKELAGHLVHVVLRDNADRGYSGRVVALESSPEAGAWDRRYERAHGGHWGWYGNPYYTGRQTGQPMTRWLILDNEQTGTREYIDMSLIASVAVRDARDTMTRRRPVLEFDVEAPDSGHTGPYTITLTYLAKGITWAPAYQAELRPDGRMRLRQQATIRNELEHFKDAEVLLISGFPSIEFAHVDAINAPGSTLAGFFVQINQQLRKSWSGRADVATQAGITSNAHAGGGALDVDFSAMDEQGSGDLHFQSIGRRSLPLGSSMVVNVAEGFSRYEHIVEWIIPDTRDVNGNLIHNNHWTHRQKDDFDSDEPWNAIRFRNPLGYPMTTAPMMITENGRFQGQRMSRWVNAGEMHIVPVTKALSIRGIHTEEETGPRVTTRRYGRSGHLTNVEGEVTVVNHRSSAATVVIRRRFSGELIDAEGEPKSRVLEEGVHAANVRNELTWEVRLEPGETRTLEYRYRVFVP